MEAVFLKIYSTTLGATTFGSCEHASKILSANFAGQFFDPSTPRQKWERKPDDSLKPMFSGQTTPISCGVVMTPSGKFGSHHPQQHQQLRGCRARRGESAAWMEGISPWWRVGLGVEFFCTTKTEDLSNNLGKPFMILHDARGVFILDSRMRFICMDSQSFRLSM